MKYILKAYSIWEYGQRKDAEGKPHQEDSIYPAFGKETVSDRLFILCDGMGGHDAGEVASATVCEAMSASVLDEGNECDGAFANNDFDQALNAAYDALDRKDNGAEKKMGTTMTFLKLYDEGVFIAHIGDSRVYQIRPGKDGEDTRIIFETRDHSLVNDLIRAGEMTREEAMHSRQKNVITRAMQPTMDRRPKADIHITSDIRPGDYFYMCSDGMLEQPDMENGVSLRNIFSEKGGDDDNKVKILKAVTKNNHDNHTAFIIHILDVIDPVSSSLAKSDDDNEFTAIVEEDSTSVTAGEDATGERKNADADISVSDIPCNLSDGGRSDKRKSPLMRIVFLVVALLAVIAAIIAVYKIGFASDRVEPVEPDFMEETDSYKDESREWNVRGVTAPAKDGKTDETPTMVPTVSQVETGHPESIDEEPDKAQDIQKTGKQLQDAVRKHSGEKNKSKPDDEGVVNSDEQTITDVNI